MDRMLILCHNMTHHMYIQVNTDNPALGRLVVFFGTTPSGVTKSDRLELQCGYDARGVII